MDRYVVEVFVTAVDEQGDELEIVTVKSPMLAIGNKDCALIMAKALAELQAITLEVFPEEYRVSAQYPSRV